MTVRAAPMICAVLYLAACGGTPPPAQAPQPCVCTCEKATPPADQTASSTSAATPLHDMVVNTLREPHAAEDNDIVPLLETLPEPEEITFKDSAGKSCRGDGTPDGDEDKADLNRLKNRIDVPDSYNSVSHAAVMKLPIAADDPRYDGVPISVEGYLADVAPQKGESPNCYKSGDTSVPRDAVDFHIFLSATRGAGHANAPAKEKNVYKSKSIVVEITPRLRKRHPTWTESAVHALAQPGRPRVRISGWRMFDPEHAAELHKTRGTLWEIHSVTKVEIQDNSGKWAAL